MKLHRLPALAATAVVITLMTACSAADPDPAPATAPAGTPTAAASPPDLAGVSPALAAYDAQQVQQLWTREGLSPRDRSLVTVAALISTGQTASLPFYVDKAIDDGVTAAEISETITHLAFYAGWPKVTAAVPGVASVFQARGVDRVSLPSANPTLLPIDRQAEDARDQQVRSDFADVSPGVVADTRDVLFRNLWLRPDLAPRDRSLVTVVALVANGQTAQVTFHLGRAIDNGLAPTEAGEVLHQLAYYAGWPNVFSALPVVRDVVEDRS